jgi:hypothetical protein
MSLAFLARQDLAVPWEAARSTESQLINRVPVTRPTSRGPAPPTRKCGISGSGPCLAQHPYLMGEPGRLPRGLASLILAVTE